MILALDRFIPHPLLFNGHAMTVAAALLPRSSPFEAEETLFQIDSDTRVRALCNWQPDRARAPTIVALHGLTGSADATYMRALAIKAVARGFNVVRINARNCGGSEHLTPTLYHSGLTEDCRSVLQQLAQAGLQKPFLVGFSMGGNVALKLSCELGPTASDWIRGVAAVSAPIQLAAASRAIDTGWINYVYQQSFLRFLIDLVRRKAQRYPARYDLTCIDRIRTLRAFDDRYIAPMFGFAGVDDYYRRASAGAILASLQIPALIIHARDDSIVPIAAIEAWRGLAPKEVTFLLSDRGGHNGFIAAARREEDRYWAENRIVEWIQRR